MKKGLAKSLKYILEQKEVLEIFENILKKILVSILLNLFGVF